jgi:hypothetical protein
MKKTLMILAVCCSGAQTFAQGTLVFANLASGVNAPASYWIGLSPTGQKVTDTNFVADLYFSNTTNAPTDSLQPAGFRVPFSSTTSGGGGGYFLGGTRTVAGATGFIEAQVRVWDSRIASTFEQARIGPLAGWGFSSPVIINLAIPPAPAPSLAGLSPFPVFIVPEPSLSALAAVGAVVFLILRHQKPRRLRAGVQ